MAGVNRFDRPARSEFLNTYVPIPFEQMVAAGQVQQQRYDKTATGLDAKMDAAAQLNAMPGSIDEDYINQYQNTLQDIVERFAGKDLGNSVIQRQLDSEIRRATKTDRLKEIQNSYIGYQAREKARLQEVAKGTYNELVESVRDPLAEGRYDSSVSGVYDYLPSATVDVRQEVSKYFATPAFTSGRFLEERDGFRIQ